MTDRLRDNFFCSNFQFGDFNVDGFVFFDVDDLILVFIRNQDVFFTEVLFGSKRTIFLSGNVLFGSFFENGLDHADGLGQIVFSLHGV